MTKQLISMVAAAVALVGGAIAQETAPSAESEAPKTTETTPVPEPKAQDAVVEDTVVPVSEKTNDHGDDYIGHEDKLTDDHAKKLETPDQDNS